jgi:hypothetical protein
MDFVPARNTYHCSRYNPVIEPCVLLYDSSCPHSGSHCDKHDGSQSTRCNEDGFGTSNGIIVIRNRPLGKHRDGRKETTRSASIGTVCHIDFFCRESSIGLPQLRRPGGEMYLNVRDASRYLAFSVTTPYREREDPGTQTLTRNKEKVDGRS